ncbi:MAG: glycine--tRNA ligase subunit alpha [Candidatus Omnitrophica bacterium]|nr:glycine--tRNA ligase subunit alpha [Candidatus Omnitrophota bacterium]
MNVQDVIQGLNDFWKKQGCAILQPLAMEVGAGTFHPATFFRSLDQEPWRCGYVQPSYRPADGRYASNPLRAQFYYQYQVILKPAPLDVQHLYLESLKHLGIALKDHDIRFVEDDWEGPTLGAWGVGWEVWLDSLEITQFTYFQQVGGINLSVIPVEITYGIERISMFLQKVYDIYALRWNDCLTYGDLHRTAEIEGSRFNFELADTQFYLSLFDEYERQARRLLKEEVVYPAYHYVLRMSHAFNILDARGAISATERPTFIGRVRAVAKRCAECYSKDKESSEEKVR